MKKIFLYLFALILLVNCAPVNNVLTTEDGKVLKPAKDESGEWTLHVIDTDYDYFLGAVAQPMTMYSEQMLKSRNTVLVSNWNAYYFSGRYRNIIESSIEYDPNEAYGLEFEYRLYQVFAYVQWKYGLRINGLSGSDIRRR